MLRKIRSIELQAHQEAGVKKGIKVEIVAKEGGTYWMPGKVLPDVVPQGHTVIKISGAESALHYIEFSRLARQLSAQNKTCEKDWNMYHFRIVR